MNHMNPLYIGLQCAQCHNTYEVKMLAPNCPIICEPCWNKYRDYYYKRPTSTQIQAQPTRPNIYSNFNSNSNTNSNSNPIVNSTSNLNSNSNSNPIVNSNSNTNPVANSNVNSDTKINLVESPTDLNILADQAMNDTDYEVNNKGYLTHESQCKKLRKMYRGEYEVLKIARINHPKQYDAVMKCVACGKTETLKLHRWLEGLECECRSERN